MSSSSDLSIYRGSLSSTVKEITLHESKWNSEGWKKAWNGINQNILNDAFDQHGLVRSIFSDIGEISQRNCKSVARGDKVQLPSLQSLHSRELGIVSKI